LRQADAARSHYEEAVAIHRAEGDAVKLAHAVRHLADVHREQGRAGLAESCYDEALDLYGGDARTTPLELANAIRGLALVKDGAGEAEQASALWERAKDLYAAAEVQAGVAESSRRLAALAAAPDAPTNIA
jgi:tetratricopeptide (TPR) repeat protein